MNSLIINFLDLVGVCYIIVFIGAIFYRHRHPSKDAIVREGCRFVIWKIKTKKEGKYFTTFNRLKSDLKLNIKGLDRQNSSEITRCVLQKLIDNKIIELDSHLEIDVYHEI